MLTTPRFSGVSRRPAWLKAGDNLTEKYVMVVTANQDSRYRQLKRKLWDSKIASSGTHPNLRNVEDDQTIAN